MHKTMSRIVVLLLVVCLALGNVVPALAADDTGSAGAVTPAAETSPAATAEATASPAATPAAETTAGTEATPTAAPTPTAESDRDSRDGGADRYADGRAAPPRRNRQFPRRRAIPPRRWTRRT